MYYRTFCRLIFFYILAIHSSSFAFMGWIEPSVEVGTKRVTGQISSLLTAWDGEEYALFAYLTGRFSNQRTQEGNFGLGLRKLNCSSVVGAYVFYDIYRTRHKHVYKQISFGFDAYTNSLDFHVNGYAPLSKTKTLGSCANGPFGQLFPDVLVIQNCGVDKQAALWGTDFEVGYRFSSDNTMLGCPELRVYGGGYYFHKHKIKTLAGPTGRVELGFYDSFGKGSQIVLGVQAFPDDLLSGQITGFFRIDIPFCPGRIPRKCCRNVCCDLALRMYERIDRLNVQVKKKKGIGKCSGPAFFENRPVSGAFVLNADDDIVTIIPTLPENALIIIDGSLGDIEVLDIVRMQPGQTLIGGGTGIALTSQKCGSANVTLPGTPGNIVREDRAGGVINIVEFGTIQNIGIQGGSYEVLGDSSPDIRIVDNRFNTLDFAPGVTNSLTLFNGADRAFVSNNSFTFTANAGPGNVISVVTSDGIQVVDNSIFSASAGTNGIIAGGTNTQVLRNDVALLNGIGIDASNSQGILVQDNVITGGAGNVGGGIYVDNASNGQFIANNITTSSANTQGILVTITSSNHTFIGNVVTTIGDGSPGVLLDGPSNITFSNGIIVTSGNGDSNQNSAGIYLENGATNVTLSNNNIRTTGVFAYGLRFDDATNSTISNNIIETTNTDAVGINIETSVVNDTFVNNTITTANANGIVLDAASNDTLNFNINTVNATGGSAFIVQDGMNFSLLQNTFRASQDGLTITDVNGINVNNNIFNNIGQDVIDVTNSTVSGNGNTSDGTGTFCNNGGGNSGTINFTIPVNSCP